MDSSSTGNGSAIPRFSRLPAPRSTAAGTRPASNIPAPPSQRAAATTTVETVKATKDRPSSNLSTTGPRLQKRASVASFTSTTSNSNSNPASEKPLSTKSLATRSNLPGRTSRTLAKPATLPRASGSRTSSVATPQRKPIALAVPLQNNTSMKVEGQARHLQNARSTSQQGFSSDLSTGASDLPGSPAPRSRKGPRPSLSDRTVESLQTIPTTPKDRRKSSFFNPSESPMAPLPRPESSLSQHGNSDDRPGTSGGNFVQPSFRTASPPRKAALSARPSRISSEKLTLNSNTANQRSASATLASKLNGVKKPLPQSDVLLTGQVTEVATAELQKSRVSAGNQSIGVKVPRTRPSLGTAFTVSGTDSQSNAASTNNSSRSVSSSSSAALRQQIAAAKAAARKERAKVDSPQGFAALVPDAFEVESHADPFNQAPKDGKHILRNRINAARLEGRLNIAAMGLKSVPEEVLQMYSTATMEECNVNWAEVVDLTKFIAADNELEELEDAIFPDRSVDDLAADEQTEGNQFGGLELLDLHGNKLHKIPMGFRRLGRLTTLNLSHNRLENAVLDVVSQIKPLKDLRLGNNALSGNLSTSICELPYLETLDLQANKLLGLPEALRELTHLRTLNVSGNQLTTLPMEALQQIPLLELDASNNMLIASLFPVGGEGGHSTLQHLNVANNSLAALTFTPTLDLLQLRTLNVTNNHLTVLPSVAGWSELITLQIGDNKVSDFPFGFTSLPKLRNANFTGNEIRLLDPEISRMAHLESLILASNPLREKKFLTMSTANIKRDLKARIAPPEPEDDVGVHSSANSSPVTVIGVTEPGEGAWIVRSNGLLDLSSKDISDDDNDSLGSFLKSNEVKQMLLRSNSISGVPPALWLGQDIRVLDLSDNVMNMDYLSDELSLPALQELNVSRCRLSSLDPLIANLQAPRLHSLNVSANRLSGALPALRNTFPLLSMLLASDNRFASISAEALLGLQTVNLASNDIAHLPPEIGLLWDEGLKSLEIGSNAFRVPNYRTLDKGTEATLRWLRDKLPSGALREDS